MNQYYSRPYGHDDHHHHQQQLNTQAGREEAEMMGIMSAGGISGMVGGQSLDDIVDRNAEEMRRQSIPVQQYQSGSRDLDTDIRRVSMMDFDDDTPASALNFSFEPPAGSGLGDMMETDHARGQRSDSLNQQARMSRDDLALNTRFANASASYSSMPQASPAQAYTSPLGPSAPNMDMDITSPYAMHGMGMPMDLSSAGLSAINTNIPPANMYQQQQFASPMMNSPPHPSFPAPSPIRASDAPLGVSDRQDRIKKTDGSSLTPVEPPPSMNIPDHKQNNTKSISRSILPPGNQSQMSHGTQGPEPATSGVTTMANIPVPWTPPPEGFPSTMANKPHMESQFKNAYSATGFDMLGVLMRVATRPKPDIDIGSVDLSCAFVVCDAQADDNPIVYCSENFERLTGYSKHMILGRNCRFLQSPDGRVQQGTKRKYVDDESILYVKNMIVAKREAQISLINYRYGGQPFMNLLTMIPITWDSDAVKFFVGFQVDLVEQPNSVTKRNPDGSYSINYQRALTMPKYVLNSRADVAMDLGQTIGRDEVSAALNTLSSGDELSKRVFDKVLLENSDDVVHVLSLKGLFLYLSPSSRKVLEYDPSELMGTALSSVCHPSDIVPVTRELKDTSSSSSVNVVFRIRRKMSGYMWFEGHGSLHTEQGKGRKCIIMVGRERPVYTLSKTDLLASGGIGDNELWTKMSTSGMFLFASANVRQILDRQPEELVGTSIQTLMRQESKAEFGRMFEVARTGRKASVKHEMINKRGQVLQAYTTLYPGDAEEGLKPTFLIAQTKLLKYSRGNHTAQRAVPVRQDSDSPSITSNTSSTPVGLRRGNSGGIETHTSAGAWNNLVADKPAETSSGMNGLPLGHQDASLASDENLFDELKTTRSTSWQYELRQMEKRNRLLAEEVQALLAARKKRKRRKGAGQLQRDCANCHTRVTPEWRRGPSGNRDLCNGCGLRYAKQLQNGRAGSKGSSKRSDSAQSDNVSKASASPRGADMANPTITDATALASVAPSEGAVRMTFSQDLVNPPLPPVPPFYSEKAVVADAQGFAAVLPPDFEEVVEPR